MESNFWLLLLWLLMIDSYLGYSWLLIFISLVYWFLFFILYYFSHGSTLSGPLGPFDCLPWKLFLRFKLTDDDTLAGVESALSCRIDGFLLIFFFFTGIWWNYWSNWLLYFVFGCWRYHCLSLLLFWAYVGIIWSFLTLCSSLAMLEVITFILLLFFSLSFAWVYDGIICQF